MKTNNAQIFILTDGCMWEKNKGDGTSFPHAIEVCDTRTGQVRYIKSGSRISFIEGEITKTRSQETYNKMPSNTQSKAKRRKIQGVSREVIKPLNKTKSV